jgi:hypothetical protein
MSMQVKTWTWPLRQAGGERPILGAMWTCPECARTFANTNQWHSCIELSLESKLADAAPHAVDLYRAFETAVSACGEFRIHPQKSRIAFISTMTFASAKLAGGWLDVSFITPEPIDDPRIRSIVCYGPTSFGHRIRIEEVFDLDVDVREWLCVAKRRGDQETLDPSSHVAPLTGRPLRLVVVPLRCEVIEHAESLALQIPRYAAEVFAGHPAVRVRLGRDEPEGVVEVAGDRCWVGFLHSQLESHGLGAGDTVDAAFRANL